jgi:hypothetical protein
MSLLVWRAVVAATLFSIPALCQNPPPDAKNALPSGPTSPNPAQPSPNNDKRILWIIPNYRTASMPSVYQSISAKKKFSIAAADAFDRGTFGLAALFAGESQLTRSEPSFGNGVPGYARYLGTAYGDLAIGDFMTEGIFPTLLHQDPRYFRKGTGGGLARLGYSVGQIFFTHTDSGGTQFNYSEIGGNATATAISMAYYPHSRDVGDAVSKFGTQIGIDMASNVLKEFWPDVRRKFSHNKQTSDSSQSWQVAHP